MADSRQKRCLSLDQ